MSVQRPERPEPLEGRDIALVELLNRVLDRGVVVSGEVVISVAEIDLLYLNVNLLLSSVETLMKPTLNGALPDRPDVPASGPDERPSADRGRFGPAGGG